MKEKWLKYLSQKGEHIVPIMERYFNDELTFSELNHELMLVDNDLNYNKFKRTVIIDQLSS